LRKVVRRQRGSGRRPLQRHLAEQVALAPQLGHQLLPLRLEICRAGLRQGRRLARPKQLLAHVPPERVGIKADDLGRGLPARASLVAGDVGKAAPDPAVEGAALVEELLDAAL
jgi:hypothetical protein